MSSDIRNFFQRKPAASGSGSGSRAVSPVNNNTKPKKRRAVISSDEEDDVKPAVHASKVDSPKPNLKKLKPSSDDAPKQKRKPVDPHAAFGDEGIVRVERPKVNKPKAAAADKLDSHFDDEALDESLAEIDTSLLEDAPVVVAKSATSKMHANGDAKKTIKAEKSNGEENGHSKNEMKAPSTSSLKVERKEEAVAKKEPTSEKKKTPASRKRTADTSINLNDSVQTDEDRFEKKRMSAAMYQQFKNRSGPANPGSKELPEGKTTCLANLTFIITGVLDSMERDEAADLIRAHGGKVTGSLSKKTSYMVQGEEAGLAKIAKAEELKTTILSEDDLLNLIRKKSGLPTVEGNSQPDMSAIPTPAVKREVQKLTETVVKMEIKSERYSTATASGSNGTRNDTVKVKTEPKTVAVSRPSYRVETEHERNIASVENQAWVDKYKPTDVKMIIGQAGASSNVVKLTNWLTKWYVNQTGPKKTARPNPWAKNDDGGFFKAALLSGPPGVGKTTTATLVARELGFDVVEFNASDTRSKRLLKEEVSELLSNKSLYGYFSGTKDAVTVKHVLLMDEVDGMAGNEDRGGLQELIALIRDSSVPVICMCNDRNHQKMRSLVNHCYDLRFARPQLNQIKGAMMTVCFREGLKLAPSVVEEIITASNNDIRQTLNYLTLMSASGAVKMPPPGDAAASKDLQASQPQRTAKKDMKLGPWEVVRKVFSADEHKTMSLADKADLFFHDYSLGPLFVQQNYLQVAPRVPKSEIPHRVAMAADSLSRGDLVEGRIRSKMAWSMLPVQAMFSSVMPGEYMSGSFTGQINFPGWLGKHSKSTKRSRMAQEIHDHTRIRTSGSRRSIRLDYAGFLIDAVARPMREHGLEGVEASLAVLREYQLLREDIDSLLELSTWPGKKNAFDGIDGRVKAALTRAYNKDVAPYSFSAAAAVKKRKADSAAEADDAAALAGGDADGGDNDAGDAAVSDDDEEDGKLENDVLIKAKKKSATAATTSKSKPKSSASSSKAGTSGRAKSSKAK